jgi:hypothetical protein
MKQTNKQLKRQKKREFKAIKKQEKEQLKKEIKQFLDQKEMSLDSSKIENQVALDEIWQTLKVLDKMSNKDLKNKLEELKQ